MTALHYSVFLACFLFLNITILYTYFLTSEHRIFDEVHNENVPLTFKNAYLIQAVSFLAGSIVLYFLSEDKTWFSEIKFPYFLGLTALCGIAGTIENKSNKKTQIFSALIELIAITGFVFLLPEQNWMTKFSLPVEVARLIAGIIWFALYKFSCALSDHFKGILVIQSLHIGFAALMLLYFSSIFVSFLQTMGMLFPIMLMLAPFYCLFHYDLPLPDSVRNIICLLITGFVFFTVPIDCLGIGSLMISYILFEFVVVLLRFTSVFFKKEKLFFCDCLMEKTDSFSFLVSLVIRYNVLMAGFIFLSTYLNLQIQFVFLSAVLYIKLYLSAISGETSRGGLIDLIKGAKETAQTGYKETFKTFSELKNGYAKKQKEKKDTSQNEQS